MPLRDPGTSQTRYSTTSTLTYPPPQQDRRHTTSRFDLVTCFETLEHVGHVHNAIETLLASCKAGGTLIISVPNEIGLPGLIKYASRKLFRKRPYKGFFRETSEARYVWSLLAGKSISEFRSPSAEGWGPHLGFDWRVVLDHLNTSNSCRVLSINSLIFGYILIVRKT